MRPELKEKEEKKMAQKDAVPRALFIWKRLLLFCY